MRDQKTAAILFADIAGSSRLYKSVGDTRAQQVIGAALAEMAAVIHEFGGEVIKTIGDEIMACFETATAAVEAAICIQRLRRVAEPRLEVRIGVHFGPTLLQDGDVFGEAVNDAAYLVGIARGGQIITSEQTVGELPEDLKPWIRPFDRVRLKGSRETAVVHAVNWEEEDATGGYSTLVMTGVMSTVVDEEGEAPELASLQLEYQARRIALSLEDVPFVVGRDPSVADLPVESDVASRDHFHIEYRRGKFVLADHSTNGTWVQFAGQDPLYFRREQVPLTGSGRIGVGRAIREDDPHLIRFSL